jgi:hypothetical protein
LLGLFAERLATFGQSMPWSRIFTWVLSLRTVMVSPSFTPTTLPDHAKQTEGMNKNKSRVDRDFVQDIN